LVKYETQLQADLTSAHTSKPNSQLVNGEIQSPQQSKTDIQQNSTAKMVAVADKFDY